MTVAIIHAQGARLGDLSYWAAILGFIVLTLSATLAPFIASRKTVSKLGKSNGEGNSLFDVGQNAAHSAEIAKSTAAAVSTSIESNFKKVFARLDKQDVKIAEIVRTINNDKGFPL